MVLGAASVAGREITGSIHSDLPVSAVVARRSNGGAEAEAVVTNGRFVLALPDVGYAEGRTQVRHWRLRAVTSDGEHPIGWPAGPGAQWFALSREGDVALSRSARGNCEVAETTRSLVLEDVDLGEGHVTVRGSWLGRVPAGSAIVLRGPRGDLTPSDVRVDPEGGVVVTVATTWVEWGLDPGPIPAGTYRLVVVCGDGEETFESVPVVGDRLWERLLEEQVSAHLRLRLVKPGRELRLVFEAPLPDLERGAYAQTRLRAAHGPDAAIEVDPGVVYLQSYPGEHRDRQPARARTTSCGVPAPT